MAFIKFFDSIAALIRLRRFLESGVYTAAFNSLNTVILQRNYETFL